MLIYSQTVRARLLLIQQFSTLATISRRLERGFIIISTTKSFIFLICQLARPQENTLANRNISRHHLIFTAFFKNGPPSSTFMWCLKLTIYKKILDKHLNHTHPPIYYINNFVNLALAYIECKTLDCQHLYFCILIFTH